MPAIPEKGEAAMCTGDKCKHWSDALEAALPAVGAMTALLIMLGILIT